jgi:hypothetical protein
VRISWLTAFPELAARLPAVSLQASASAQAAGPERELALVGAAVTLRGVFSTTALIKAISAGIHHRGTKLTGRKGTY